MVGQCHSAKWSRNPVLFAKRRNFNEIWPIEIFAVRPGRYCTRKLLYEARSILRDSSHNWRTQVAVIHKKWWDKTISRNDHEIRFFSSNDATLTRYYRLKLSQFLQGVIALGSNCTKFDHWSAIAVTIRGLKLRKYMNNGPTMPFRELITKFGPHRQTTQR